MVQGEETGSCQGLKGPHGVQRMLEGTGKESALTSPYDIMTFPTEESRSE